MMKINLFKKKNIFKDKINLFYIYYFIVLLTPIGTLFQQKIEIINKLLVFIMFGIIFLIFLVYKIHMKLFIFLIVSIISFLISLYITGYPDNMNMIFYFISWILNVIMFINYKNELILCIKKNKNTLLYIILFWHISVIISLFLPSSYMYSEGIMTFTSFTGDTFRLCTSSFCILAFILPLMKLYQNKTLFIFSFLPMACLFIATSRTYFFIGVLLFLIVYYHFFKNKNLFVVSIIPILCVGGILFFSTSISDKFLDNMQDGYYGFLATFTSGRSLFWKTDIEYYLSSPIFNKIFGLGLDKSVEINKFYHNREIWAHNDFIECLIAGGIVQLCLYLISIKALYSTFLKNTNKLIVFVIFSIWFFDSFINMFYTYFCTYLGMLFLLLFISMIYPKKNKKEKFI